MMLKFIKALFEPKVGSDRWLRIASKDDIMKYWDALSKIVRDPNADMDERIHIRDHVIPYLRKVVYDRFDN